MQWMLLETNGRKISLSQDDESDEQILIDVLRTSLMFRFILINSELLQTSVVAY